MESEPPRSERWRRLRAALERALELDEPERLAGLAADLGDDPQLLAEARILLERSGEEDGYLEPQTRVRSSAAERLERQPEVVPGFRVLRLLGSGGMGAVYEARQQSPARRVALKVLRSALAGAREVRRFQEEIEILARLHHPHIAQVYQAGTYADPQWQEAGEVPWFAMEYVDGARPLDEYAREAGLGVDASLRLFLHVCAAVQYSHECGVIHRDLKPGNVLVDRHGHPKLIDFGIAQAAGLPGVERDALLLTRTGEILGTLQFLSPERLGDAGVRADLRCDVYALGALLYELICGAPALRLEGRSLTECMRAIREEPPIAPRKLRPDLAPDLAWILLKCLEKEPGRRYSSVAALAEDLRRFLDGAPIAARPPSSVYRLRRLVARHRALAGAGLVALLALGTGAAFGVRGMLRAAVAEQRALGEQVKADLATKVAAAQKELAEERLKHQKEAEISALRAKGAAAVSDAADRAKHHDLRIATLQGIALETLWTEVARELHDVAKAGAQASLSEVLPARVAELDHGPELPLEVEIALRRSLGKALLVAEAPGQAVAQFERALALSRRELGAQTREANELLMLLIDAHRRQGAWSSAHAALAPLVRTRLEQLDEWQPSFDELERLVDELSLAGGLGQAETLLSLRWQTLAARHGTHSEAALGARLDLATFRHCCGLSEPARQGLRELLPEIESAVGAAHPLWCRAAEALALASWPCGGIAERMEAIDLLTLAAERWERASGPLCPNAARARRTLLMGVCALGLNPGAFARSMHPLELEAARLRELEFPGALRASLSRGLLLTSVDGWFTGPYGGARLAHEAIEASERSGSVLQASLAWAQANHFDASWGIHEAAHSATRQRTRSEIGRLLGEPLEPLHTPWAIALLLLDAGLPEQALSVLVAAEHSLRARAEQSTPDIARVFQLRSIVEQALGREAAWRDTLGAVQAGFAPGDPERCAYFQFWVEALARAGDCEDGLEVARELANDCAASLGPEHERTLSARETVLQLELKVAALPR